MRRSPSHPARGRGGDTENLAHDGDGEGGLVRSPAPPRRAGNPKAQRVPSRSPERPGPHHQAAAFAKRMVPIPGRTAVSRAAPSLNLEQTNCSCSYMPLHLIHSSYGISCPVRTSASQLLTTPGTGSSGLVRRSGEPLWDTDARVAAAVRAVAAASDERLPGERRARQLERGAVSAGAPAAARSTAGAGPPAARLPAATGSSECVPQSASSRLTEP